MSCLPCKPGFYCEEKTIFPTKECEAGFYCPTNITDGISNNLIGSYGSKQVPCPAGTYTATTQTKDISGCLNCTVGFYCLEGTANPIDCPRGYYCPPKSDTPLPCPLGTYGNQTNLQYKENCTLCTPGW